MGSFASTVFSLLLGWMRSAVSGLWSMLSSEGSGNLLQWLGNHWLGVTVVLCAVCTVVDLVIHLIRWRPYKVWASFFRRLRGKQELSAEPDSAPPRTVAKAPRLRRQWVYPDGNTRTEEVYVAPEEPPAEADPWPEAPAPTLTDAYAAPLATGGSYLQRYARPAPELPDEPLRPSPALERMQTPERPISTAEVKGLEGYPPPRDPASVEEVAPEPIAREPEPDQETLSRSRRMLRRMASLPKNFLIDDSDDELQLRYQPVQPAVDKKQAYHEPVYPPSWRPPADAGASRREEQE